MKKAIWFIYLFIHLFKNWPWSSSEISMFSFNKTFFFDFKSFSFHHLGLSNLVRNRSTCWWWSGFLFLDSCRDRFHFVVPNYRKKKERKNRSFGITKETERKQKKFVTNKQFLSSGKNHVFFWRKKNGFITSSIYLSMIILLIAMTNDHQPFWANEKYISRWL